jgi:hypothetical protein
MYSQPKIINHQGHEVSPRKAKGRISLVCIRILGGSTGVDPESCQSPETRDVSVTCSAARQCFIAKAGLFCLLELVF